MRRRPDTVETIIVGTCIRPALFANIREHPIGNHRPIMDEHHHIVGMLDVESETQCVSKRRSRIPRARGFSFVARIAGALNAVEIERALERWCSSNQNYIGQILSKNPRRFVSLRHRDMRRTMS